MYDFNNNETNKDFVESGEHTERREQTQNYDWQNNQYTGSSYHTQPEKKEKKSSGTFRKIMVAACCGLCFGLFAGVGLFAVNQFSDLNLWTQQEYQSTTGNSIGETENSAYKEDSINAAGATQISVVTSDYTAVVKKVMPSMVSIVNNYVEEQQSFWGQSYSYEGQSSGSGIIIGETEEELLIATNHHVVSGANTIEVTFIDDSVATAQVKGTDSDMDLAVIAIPIDALTNDTRQSIAVAKMGDSDALNLGEPVIAIGNALGYGQSVTGGYVSALDREVELEDGSTGTFIQTDAAINPGNSGGALLNINGEVIGINSNKIGGSTIEGMGYAIPITAAEPIIEDLMSKETRYKVEDGNVGYMGVNLLTIPAEYNFPEGVFVRSVEAGSPAEQAGIISGDFIVNFDGEKISSNEDLLEALQYYAPGATAEITVMRATNGVYEKVALTITLGTNPNRQQ